MNRRTFLCGLTLGTLSAPLIAEPQQADRVYRLGVLAPVLAAGPRGLAGIATGLRRLGYIEGQNLRIEQRVAEGKPDRLPELARELVELRVDVILAIGGEATQAAKAATKTVPIVMGFASDPVGRGLVAGLARPGSNITGVAYSPDDADLVPKRLELIKEAVPRAERVAVLSSGGLGSQVQVQVAHQAAPSLGVRLIVVEVQNEDYDQAFAAMVAARAEALFVLSTPTLVHHRKRIIDLAAKHRLPAIYEWRWHVEEGGLMAYGGNLGELYRRVFIYVDRIFKGANPADLPIEQPTKFGLVINLRTAKALGLTIPPSLLVRADQVIE